MKVFLLTDSLFLKTGPVISYFLYIKHPEKQKYLLFAIKALALTLSFQILHPQNLFSLSLSLSKSETWRFQRGSLISSKKKMSWLLLYRRWKLGFLVTVETHDTASFQELSLIRVWTVSAGTRTIIITTTLRVVITINTLFRLRDLLCPEGSMIWDSIINSLISWIRVSSARNHLVITETSTCTGKIYTSDLISIFYFSSK